ncbi:MAG: hypothetical protein KAI67_06415 [Candidatus Pacebacteria bacterium]|nr:hypothetical protein [Candidatus Paceibacterota bacterium]
MERIESIVTSALVKRIVEDSENFLTIPKLAEKIKTETNGGFIRRKIIERLSQMEKSGFFCLEERLIHDALYQYERVIVLSS